MLQSQMLCDNMGRIVMFQVPLCQRRVIERHRRVVGKRCGAITLLWADRL
jgi:hypothetical protein